MLWRTAYSFHSFSLKGEHEVGYSYNAEASSVSGPNALTLKPQMLLQCIIVVQGNVDLCDVFRRFCYISVWCIASIVAFIVLDDNVRCQFTTRAHVNKHPG